MRANIRSPTLPSCMRAGKGVRPWLGVSGGGASSCTRGADRQGSCVSRQLYEVLAHKSVAGRRMPVLLAANKADAGIKAHTADFIRKRLEREL